MYLYETHCHEKLCSACARATPEELVENYKKKGYAGLVLTDHFLSGNTSVSYSLPYKEQIQKYYDAYLKAKSYGEKIDFDVIFGFEHQYGGWKEMLVYGVEIDFLLKYPNLLSLGVDDFVKAVRKNGGVVVLAHPYRYRWYIDMNAESRFDLADGVEVYNAYNTSEENVKALKKCREKGLIALSGGDIHSGFDDKLNLSGVYLKNRVKNSKEFAEAIKSKDFDLRVLGKRVKNITENDL